MRPMVVKVGPEIEQLVFEICCRPEQNTIQIPVEACRLAFPRTDETVERRERTSFLSLPVSAGWLATGGTDKADRYRKLRKFGIQRCPVHSVVSLVLLVSHL
jgi:hypothetical protein